jgi:hypothetical protein
LSTIKEVVVTLKRRRELVDFVELWQRHLAEEHIKIWRSDVEADRADRAAWIQTFASTDLVYSPEQESALQRCMEMLAVFGPGKSLGNPISHNRTVDRAETKSNEETGEVYGVMDGIIHGATPLDIIAYAMCFNGRHIQSDWDIHIDVISELIDAGPHHAVCYVEKRSPPLQNRTFLNQLVCKKLSDDPSTYILAAAPLATHEYVDASVEKWWRKVRAEAFRGFRLTQTETGKTRMEYVCFVDLKGRVPSYFTAKVVVPQQTSLMYVNFLSKSPLPSRRVAFGPSPGKRAGSPLHRPACAGTLAWTSHRFQSCWPSARRLRRTPPSPRRTRR